MAATLHEYRIRRVKDADFPGIVSMPNEAVEGEVLLDLTEDELSRFDQYEDSFYSRESVLVRLNEKESITSQTYVIPPDLAESILSGSSWSSEWFRQNCHRDFVLRLKRWLV